MKIFAVDVGGTNLKLAVIDETGTISKRWNISSKSQDAPDKIIDSIIERFKEAGKIDACGISTAGIVKQPEGIVVESPNFPLWKNVHLKKTMESKTGSRVVVDNDANCALLAEYWKGNTAGCKNAVLLTLGTGIGGGCMSNSMLVRGRSGYGGEVGHIMIDPKGGLCGCGGKGHLETFCSSYGLRELSIKSGIKDLPDEVGKIPEFLYMNAVKGDKLSLKVWSHYGTYLGMGISGLINIFNPEVVLLGGGISKAFKLFESSMHRQISLSYKIILTDCRITTSKFPDDGGLLGASYLAIESLKP